MIKLAPPVATHLASPSRVRQEIQVAPHLAQSDVWVTVSAEETGPPEPFLFHGHHTLLSVACPQ
jgi:hypothetical protein